MLWSYRTTSKFLSYKLTSFRTRDVSRVLRVNPEGIKDFKVCSFHLYDIIDCSSFRRYHGLGESIKKLQFLKR